MTRRAEVVETWLELAQSMTMRDLAASGPRASLASGATGIADVLSRIGRREGDSMLVAASKRWLAIARRASRRRDGHRCPGWRSSASSVMFGPLGVAATGALLTGTPHAVATYISQTRRTAPRAPAEYMFGLAGSVFAAIRVERATRDPRVRMLLRDLAVRLATRRLPPTGGFAHGDLGVIAARLAASHTLNESIDPRLVATLAAIDPRHVLARGGPLVRSWCNGLAGYTLAWVLAAEIAGCGRCRDHAHTATQHLLHELDEGGGSVCCGLGGRAYALLAVARLDPEGRWDEHADRLATRAFAHELGAGGSVQGLPGLVALARDLEVPAHARFPWVDVI